MNVLIYHTNPEIFFFRFWPPLKHQSNNKKSIVSAIHYLQNTRMYTASIASFYFSQLHIPLIMYSVNTLNL